MKPRGAPHRATMWSAKSPCSRALCGELINEVAYACQQYHGGFGYMRGTGIERMVRDARVQTIGGGATEVMLEEVAKRMDGLFG